MHQELINPLSMTAKSRAHMTAVDASLHRLTTRETEVLILIAQGKTTKEIARALRMSFKTAVSHRYNIQQKFHPHGTADLTRAAIRMGLVEP